MPFNSKQLSLALAILSIIICCSYPEYVFADNRTDEGTEELPVMPVVEVEATRIAPTTGAVLIDKELIDSLPSRNGSVNEIIGIIPGIQYGEKANSSFTGGEITPPGVTISGSRFYDNNYTIDGVSNNNPIDPGNTAHNYISKTSGFPQGQFLSPRIIEQIKVYNSNIPAEFGGFTGGRVDAKTIDPSANFWGKVNYRTTRDNWTKFYISPDDEDSFTNSNSEKYQPKFKKQDVGFILNLPLSSNTGLIGSYQQLRSDIPLRHLDVTKNQTRKRENLFLKLSHDLSNYTNLSITALYSPTEGEYFSKDFKESDYRLQSGGYSVAINIESEFTVGLLHLTIGYNGQDNQRQGPENRYFWDPSTASIDWETGKEGGLGALETGYDELSIKSDFAFVNVSAGQTEHQIKLGAEATYSSQHLVRPKVNYYYYSPKTTGVINCQNNDPACIENEQYLSRRTKYFNIENKVEINDVAAFLQDAIAWKRIELFPGVRASYDDYTNNLNVAPRLSASLDLFGNRNSIIFAGKNRYYSGALLTHALYSGRFNENQKRTSTDNDESDWIISDSYIRRESDVKTPYSDEVTVGALQKILGGELKIQYIEKTNKDEITRSSDKDLKQYTLNNNGRSEHKSFQLSWQRAWRKHFVEVNSTWQTTTSNHFDYDTILNDDALATTIWYNGKELYKHEIPRLDYNRPVVANLIYSGRLPYGFTFTNTTKYRGPYTRLKNTGTREPSVVDPDQSPDPYVYEKQRQHSSLIFDWRINWSIPEFAARNVVLSVDIYNVFNRKAGYGSGADDYELGRQYWAGLEFNF